MLAPFSPTSIWNTPIGRGAVFVPAHIYDAARGFAPPVNFHNDQEFGVQHCCPSASAMYTPVRVLQLEASTAFCFAV